MEYQDFLFVQPPRPPRVHDNDVVPPDRAMIKWRVVANGGGTAEKVGTWDEWRADKELGIYVESSINTEIPDAMTLEGTFPGMAADVG